MTLLPEREVVVIGGGLTAGLVARSLVPAGHDVLVLERRFTVAGGVGARLSRLRAADIRPGNRLGDVSAAVQQWVEQHGYAVVREFVGHGIGEQFHTDLQIPHYYEPRMTTIMEPGMVFTIEPMISMGTGLHKIWDDDWTAVTADGSRTAQFEHMLVVTDTAVEILTAAN